LTAETGALSGSDLRNIGRAFDQEDVGLAGLNETVSDTASNSAAADDDVFRIRNW
jgi:hypothetical protein